MNLLKLTILGASTLLFIGCSSAQEDAVTGMFDALANGDSDALMEHSTKNTVGLLVMAGIMKCKANKSDFNSKKEYAVECMKETFGNTDVENIEVTEESDTSAYAMVTVSTKGKLQKAKKIDLVKVDDTWKVNIKK